MKPIRAINLKSLTQEIKNRYVDYLTQLIMLFFFIKLIRKSL